MKISKKLEKKRCRIETNTQKLFGSLMSFKRERE